MKKIKLKDISLAYKVSIVSAFLLLAINVLSVIFVLLPIYGLLEVTDPGQSSVEIDKKLEKAENTTGLMVPISFGLAIVSVVSGGYGVYQDVRKKPKTKS